MDSILLEKMKFQGWLRLYLTQCGIDEEAALIASGKILDRLMSSLLVKDEYKQAYEATKRNDEP